MAGIKDFFKQRTIVATESAATTDKRVSSGRSSGGVSPTKEGDDDNVWSQKLTRSKRTLVKSDKTSGLARSHPPRILDDDEEEEEEGEPVVVEKKDGQQTSTGGGNQRKRIRTQMEDEPGKGQIKPSASSSSPLPPPDKKIANDPSIKREESPPPKRAARDMPAASKDSVRPSTPPPPSPPSPSSLPSLPPVTKASSSPGKKFNYREYLQKRSTGPIAPGSKEIPQGAPGCLLGLTFVFTGELESLSREEAQDLVKRHGGRTTTAPSGRTSYVVVGADAGASKLEKVRALGLKTLTEDDLLELIRTSAASSKDGEPTMTTLPVGEKSASPMKRSSPVSKRLPKVPLINAGMGAEEMWTEKYAPQTETDLIGNHAAYEKLVHWLQGWSGQPPAGNERAVLISGPPGIGKTTAAHMACRQLALEVVEMNASDTRSRASLQEHVREMIDNRSISGYDFFAHAKVLIMDEVDGMSAGDRGGMVELIQLIKKSRIPIICICNDRSSPKVRSLANYCLDLRFRRPDARQVAPRILAIAQGEGLRLGPNVLEELVASTQGDIRQILTLLSTYRLRPSGQDGITSLDYDEGKRLAGDAKKDIDLGPFDAVPALLGGAHARMTLSERIDMYFVDSSLVPLMVQENYLRAKANTAREILGRSRAMDLTSRTRTKSASFMDLAAAAADSISEADLVEGLIRGANQEWSLAPLHAVLSSVLPAYYCHGSMTGRVEFASWLGQNSKASKGQRLLGEITKHSYLADGGCSRQEMRLTVLPVLAKRLLRPLQMRGAEGAEESIAALDAYSLSRDDLDSVLELVLDPSHSMAAYGKLPATVKTAFTRRYNQGTHRLPYSLDGGGGLVLRRVRAVDEEIGKMDEEEMEMEPEFEETTTEADGTEEVDLTKDKMIRVKSTTKTTTAAKASKGSGAGVKNSSSTRGRPRK